MENFSVFNKQVTFTQSQGDFQEYSLQSSQNPSPNTKNKQLTCYQQKAPFLRYASSLLEIRNEDQSKIDHTPVYEESELLNPPSSLIEKYETMRIQRASFGNISCQSKKQNSQSIKKILKGLTILAAFLENQSFKKHQNTFSLSSSLIDILAICSTQNFISASQKSALKEGFFKIKSFYHRNFQKQKTTKPLIPTDKKKNYTEILSFKKKQGTEQLVGSLTFRTLVLESQCFKSIKIYVLKKKVQTFCFAFSKIFIQSYFNSIRELSFTNPSRFDSKILTLSKSKSKSSFSKLKVHPSSSQKKLTIKKPQNHEDSQITMGNQRVISSQILQNFDFTQFKSKISEDQAESKERKIQFNNRLKKKNIKETSSQAETINSKRSSQSEYQLAQVVNSKISTTKKPISAKNFNSEYGDALAEIPTEKFIRKKNIKQKFQYEKNLFAEEINAAKKVQVFKRQKRRYLNVRTNLYELPLQINVFNKTTNPEKKQLKQKMTKIYHMIPDGFIRNEAMQDEITTLATNLNLITTKKHKDIENFQKIEKYYFDLGIEKNGQHKQLTQKITKRLKSEPQNLAKEENMAKKQEKRSPKMKSKKPDNFEDYYFNAQINKNQQTILKKIGSERESESKTKFSKLINQNNYQSSIPAHIHHVQSSKESNKSEYNTLKLETQFSQTKNFKSLSPSVKFSLHSPRGTQKLNKRLIQQNTVDGKVLITPQNSNNAQMHKNSSQVFFSTENSNLKPLNQLPVVEPQLSEMKNPQYMPQMLSSNPSIISQNRSKSKLKLFSQSPRSLSPLQNHMVQHFFPPQNSERKVSFVTNMTPQKMIHFNRPPSTSVFPQTQGSNFTPSNSNLSNQSGLTNNMHKVIKYGPSVGQNQEMANRPSSILSTHSSHDKQQILIGRNTQRLLSPTQRQMHNMVTPSGILQNVNLSPRMVGIQYQRPKFQNQQMNVNYSTKGLNVMMSRDQKSKGQGPSPNSSLSKLNPSTRPKSISKEKIFLTLRK